MDRQVKYRHFRNLPLSSTNISLLFSCLQAAVEVPQYVGVNLLVEGAHIRRSKLPHRLPIIPNPPRPEQPPLSEKTVPTWKTSGNEASRATTAAAVAATAPFLSSDKENRTVGNLQKASHVCRPRRGWGCMSYSELRRKSQRLVLVDSAPLLPWNLSFALISPPDRVQSNGYQSRLQPPVSHTSRSSLPQCAALERKSKSTSTTSTTTRHQALSSLEGPLPTMQVLRLQPNICGRISFHP